MANYQLLKADIDAKVYQNGQQEITGENLNSVLNAMVTTLGAEYQFAGVATIDTEPGTPDAKVFYIANGKGTYTNFGGLEVTEDEVVVLYYDTEWHKVSTGIASQAKLSELEDNLSQIAVPSRIDKWNLLEYEGIEYLDKKYHDNDDIDKKSNNEFVIKNIPIGLAKGSVLYVYSDWGNTNYQSDGYNTKYACRGVAFYRKDKSLISSIYRYTSSPITIPNDAEYATLTMMYADVSTLDKGVIWVTKRSKNDHFDITYKAKTKVDNEYPSNYIHARRAIVSFTLDGDYDMNQAMKAVFDSHGMKCGVAPVYTNINQHVGIARYLKWQDEGFEIMTHGGVILGNLPEEEAIRKIQESYYTMKEYGFDVKGYISSSGYADPKFIPYIADLYDWAVTTNDHGATSESCYEFGVDHPYKLWRYSMQLATLQQMKNAIDRAIEQRRVVAFYGHAQSDGLRNFTSENLDALLMYCEEKGIKVMTPTDAIKDFFSLRYNDIYLVTD